VWSFGSAVPPITSSHLFRVLVVADTIRQLRDIGFQPVLVGGMALVIMGSLRVTRDFDFVIAHPADRLDHVVEVFYDRGFEIVSRLNEAGDVTATIDNRRIASARLRLDRPTSAYFYSVAKRVRIDLFFDFPLPAIELLKKAKRAKILSHVFDIASPEDLLRLKELAQASRSFAGEPAWMSFVRAGSVGHHFEEDARVQLAAFQQGFSHNV